MRTGKTLIPILVSIGVVVIGLVVWRFVVQTKPQSTSNQQTSGSNTKQGNIMGGAAPIDASIEAMKGWVTFTNTKYQYTMTFPQDWSPVATSKSTALPLTSTDPVVTISRRNNDGFDESIIIQSCDSTVANSCPQKSLADWKQIVGFTVQTDPETAVKDFEAGRTRANQLYYVRESESQYWYIFASQSIEKFVQPILSTYTFTK